MGAVYTNATLANGERSIHDSEGDVAVGKCVSGPPGAV